MSKSKVWKYFEKNSKDNECAKFKQCPRESNEIKRANNTSNLWSHLQLNHKHEYKELNGNNNKENNQTELLINKSTSTSANNSIVNMLTTSKPVSKEKIDRLIADMIIIDTQPYSIVEDNGFLALLSVAFPYYKVPCRNYFVNYIEKLCVV